MTGSPRAALAITLVRRVCGSLRKRAAITSRKPQVVGQGLRFQFSRREDTPGQIGVILAQVLCVLLPCPPNQQGDAARVTAQGR